MKALVCTLPPLQCPRLNRNRASGSDGLTVADNGAYGVVEDGTLSEYPSDVHRNDSGQFIPEGHSPFSGVIRAEEAGIC